jgi:ABC-type polysaccharide/polyol phosphate transport system ATPase subunit
MSRWETTKRKAALIEFSAVSKSFLRHPSRMLLRNHLKFVVQGVPSDRFYALKDISFVISHGENVGIVGANGAGKSTLLSLVVGLSGPDKGRVNVVGTAAGLLDLGSGFHPDLTGRENLFLNASLLGLTRKRAAEIYDEVVEFSDIGDFIHQPLRTYSTGMMLRLAFSVAVNINPDFLIVDEVLAVGDQGFQKKCFAKIADLKRRGVSLLCVSHSPGVVEQLCERTLWLDHGELVADGKTADVLKLYVGQATMRRVSS